jgi:hypothetical protein
VVGNRESNDINNGIKLVAEEIAPGDLQVVLKHTGSFKVIKVYAKNTTNGNPIRIGLFYNMD